MERRHHSGPEQRRQQDGLGDGRWYVGDAHLDGRELSRRADIPIDHAVVEHDAGLAEHLDRRVVLIDGIELRRRSRIGQARPQHAAKAGIAGVGVAIDRRVGAQRQEQRQPWTQPVTHPDRDLATGYRDVHVASADALLVGEHAELLSDVAVARGVGSVSVIGNSCGTVGGSAAASSRAPLASAASAATRRSRRSWSRSSALPPTTSLVVSIWQLVSSSCSLTPCRAAWSATALFTATGSPVVGSARRNSSSTPRVGWLTMAKA